nr:heme-binding protein [Nocardioides sp. Soil774]
MTEQQHYEVVREYSDFELRRYPDHVVAETRVTGSFEGAGNASFRRLAGYIGGRNAASRKVAMTAPVVQEAEDEAAGRFVVGFVMPAELDRASAPDPSDPDVQLRSVPAQTAAALRFSGRGSATTSTPAACTPHSTRPASRPSVPRGSRASTRRGPRGSCVATRSSYR